MRKGTRRFSVVVFAAAALSTLAITCRSTDALAPTAPTVELRQVQKFASVFNRVIDQAIVNRSGSRISDEVDICGDRSVQGVFANHVFVLGGTRAEVVRGTRADAPEQRLTVAQLQELRALVNLRVDEAFKAGPDTSRYQDILNLQFDRNGINGTVAAPHASVKITGLQ